MSDFLDLIESMDASQASIRNLFNGDGTAVNSAVGHRKQDPRYQQIYTEGVRLIANVFNARRPFWQLREAMSTADFPLILGDTLDRMMLAEFRDHPSNWQRWMRVSRVRDFRAVKRFRMSDGDQRLSQVGEGESYPQGERDEATYSFNVNKYGRRFDLFWEALINDDLDALQNFPALLARAARRTVDHFASSLYVANATLYSATHAVDGVNYSNIDTAALTLTSLKAAWNAMAGFPGDANSDGVVEPVFNTPTRLVVGRQNELLAKETVGQINFIDSTETNVLRGMFEIEVDPYIDIIDPTNGPTSWYLFANPADGHAVEVATLIGHEDPQLFVKDSNARRLGGGDQPPEGGDFDTDAVGYKVRHVIGGSHANATGGWRFTYWSDGTT